MTLMMQSIEQVEDKQRVQLTKNLVQKSIFTVFHSLSSSNDPQFRAEPSSMAVIPQPLLENVASHNCGCHCSNIIIYTVNHQ